MQIGIPTFGPPFAFHVSKISMHFQKFKIYTAFFVNFSLSKFWQGGNEYKNKWAALIHKLRIQLLNFFFVLRVKKRANISGL